MTVSSTSSRVVYNGNGSTTVFPFAFKVQTPADLTVVFTDPTGTDLVLSASQYAATGFGQDAGGTVTYAPNGSPIASGTRLTIYRQVSPTQPTSISNQGAMWPAVIEAALDRLTFIVQYFLDGLSRALTISPTDGGTLNPLPNAMQRANAVLGFDGTGQPIAVQLTGGLVAMAQWLVQNFFPAGTSAANACAALGAFFLTGNNTVSGNNGFSGTNTFPTQGANDSSSKAATTAYADRSAANAVAGYVIRSFLAGLGLSNDSGMPDTKLDVAAGVCADDTNAALLTLAAGTIDCTTTGANGLDSGSLANSTWYHVFAIAKAAGANPALLASASLSSPTLPSGYTLKRRLGSFKTDGSAHILAFVQAGDYFRWKASVLDVADTNPGTSAVLKTLSVPPGAKVKAVLNLFPNFASNANALCQVSDPDANDEAPSSTVAPLGVGGGISTQNGVLGWRVEEWTNASAQIRYRISASGASDVVRMATLGWTDSRGKNA